jgi:hypothetical protein
MQMDRRTDERRGKKYVTNLTVAFRYFADAPENDVFVFYSLLVDYNALLYTYVRIFVYVSVAANFIIPLMCGIRILSCNKTLKIKTTSLPRY